MLLWHFFLTEKSAEYSNSCINFAYSSRSINCLSKYLLNFENHYFEVVYNLDHIFSPWEISEEDFTRLIFLILKSLDFLAFPISDFQYSSSTHFPFQLFFCNAEFFKRMYYVSVPSKCSRNQNFSGGTSIQNANLYANFLNLHERAQSFQQKMLLQ